MTAGWGERTVTVLPVDGEVHAADLGHDAVVQPEQLATGPVRTPRDRLRGYGVGYPPPWLYIPPLRKRPLRDMRQPSAPSLVSWHKGDLRRDGGGGDGVSKRSGKGVRRRPRLGVPGLGRLHLRQDRRPVVAAGRTGAASR